MNPLSIGTISALFLAGAAAPAALAQAQMQPGQMQPGQMQPGQMQPGQMQPGQMQPGQMQPGQMQPGQMQAPRPMQTQPSAMELRSMRGAALQADQISPFQVTAMALQGELSDSGIGGAHYLRNDVRQGRVNGRDIVAAAVEQGLISPEVRDDQGFIGYVNQYLRTQERDWRN
jgi:pentapeptide MXKDX repeat protein